MTPRWQRREFLRLALIQLGSWPLVAAIGCNDRAASSVALGRAGGGDAGAAPAATDVSAALHAQVADLQLGALLDKYLGASEHEHIQHIGARYLMSAAPDLSDAKVLALIEPTIRRIERHVSDKDVIASLRNAIKTEFEGVEVIDLDGWTLAPTEAALCALLWIAEAQLPTRDGGAGADDDGGG